MGDNLGAWINEAGNQPPPIAIPIWGAAIFAQHEEIPVLSAEETARVFDLEVGEHVKLCCMKSTSRFHTDCDGVHVSDESIAGHLAANRHLFPIVRGSITYVVNIGFQAKETVWDCIEREEPLDYNSGVPRMAGIIGESKNAVVTVANDVKVDYYDTLDEMSKNIASNRLELLIVRRDIQEMKEALKFIHDSLFYAPDGPGAEAAKKDYSNLCHHTYD